MTTSTFCRPTPWLFELAAQLEEEAIENLFQDAGTISRSLTGAVDLFDLPAVCVPIDTTLEAEAAGCDIVQESVSEKPQVEGIIETIDDALDVDIGEITNSGRVPVMVNAADRLADTCDATVFGGVTGPALLTEQLLKDPVETSGDVREESAFTAGELGVEVAGAYLEVGVDGIALLEPEGLDSPMYREAAEPIANLLTHYEATGAVITTHTSTSDIRLAGNLGFDLITGAISEVEDAIDTAAEVGIDIGVGVPRDTFLNEDVASFCERVQSDVLFSSQWTVPADTSPEAVHQLMDQ